MPRFLLAFLLFCTTALADKPRGFLTINWGASPEEAKRVMQARPGVKFPEDADDYKFDLTGGTFAGQPVLKWTLEFPERKFASATVVIKGEDPQSLYKEFRAQLVSKYGSATTSQKIKSGGPKPYNAPRTAPGGSVTSWKFPPNLKDKSNLTISCELSGPNGAPTQDPAQMQLIIRYTNETLTTAAATNAEAGAKATAPVGVKKDDL
jgi:hypothetical protein